MKVSAWGVWSNKAELPSSCRGGCGFLPSCLTYLPAVEASLVSSVLPAQTADPTASPKRQHFISFLCRFGIYFCVSFSFSSLPPGKFPCWPQWPRFGISLTFCFFLSSQEFPTQNLFIPCGSLQRPPSGHRVRVH